MESFFESRVTSINFIEQNMEKLYEVEVTAREIGWVLVIIQVREKKERTGGGFPPFQDCSIKCNSRARKEDLQSFLALSL